MIESPIQYLELDSNSVVNCYVDSNPEVEYTTWTKDGKNLESPSLFRNGSLRIDKVTKMDGGNYSCTPYNQLGSSGSSDPMKVIVRRNTEVRFGETVMLDCESEGEEVNWMKNGLDHPIETNSVNANCTFNYLEYCSEPEEGWNCCRLEMVGTSLKIFRAKEEDRGMYICIPENSVSVAVT